MTTPMRKTLLCATLSGLMFGQNVYAQEAVSDVPLTKVVATGFTALSTALSTVGTSLSTILEEIDSDIGGIGAKLAGSSVLASNTQREMAVEIQRQQEIDKMTLATELPIDPCATSGSNYAMQAVQGAHTTASSFRPGGSATVSSAPLQKALNSPAPSVEASRRATAAIHQATYCNANEISLGYANCTASTMPDGDANADSLYVGAGLPGKAPDLTFTPAQIEAARAYARVSIDPEPPQNITQAESGTEMGKLYIAMQKAYQANISSAQTELNNQIAAHTPFPGSTQLISDINSSSDSAQQYFNASASPVAKSTNTMSLAELEDFEAGRRWRNPFWQIEMGAVADPTKLEREQVFTTAFIADQIHLLATSQERTNVLLAQILASNERAIDRPAVEAQLQRTHAANIK